MLQRTFKQKYYRRLLTVGLLALSGCAQPTGFDVQGASMPVGDESHPAALRNVAVNTQTDAIGGTLSALFTFPEQASK